MNQEKKRIGRFTSSEVYLLFSEPTAGKKKEGEIFGAPAKNYIEETNFERLLGRSISEDINSRPTSWGNLLELKASKDANVLGLDYELTSKVTICHPTIDCYAGSPDGIIHSEQGNVVFDVKSPYTLKSFCQLYQCKTIQELRDNYKYGEQYFWQLVGNSILTDCSIAELLVYCPFKSELQSIRDMAHSAKEEEGQRNFFWVDSAMDDDLPYIPDGNPNYDHIHKIRFEVTDEIKTQLTNRVLEAQKLLIQI